MIIAVACNRTIQLGPLSNSNISDVRLSSNRTTTPSRINSVPGTSTVWLRLQNITRYLRLASTPRGRKIYVGSPSPDVRNRVATALFESGAAYFSTTHGDHSSNWVIGV